MLSIRPWIPRSRRERREAGARIPAQERLVKPKIRSKRRASFGNWLGRIWNKDHLRHFEEMGCGRETLSALEGETA